MCDVEASGAIPDQLMTWLQFRYTEVQQGQFGENPIVKSEVIV
jgi:hypothetical protein